MSWRQEVFSNNWKHSSGDYRIQRKGKTYRLYRHGKDTNLIFTSLAFAKQAAEDDMNGKEISPNTYGVPDAEMD